VSIMEIDHLTVITDDLEATSRFYAETLGLTPGPALGTPDTKWFYAGEKPLVHVLHQAQTGSLAHLGSKPGLDHIAFTIRGFDAFHRRLRATAPGLRSQMVGKEKLPRLFATDPNGVLPRKITV